MTTNEMTLNPNICDAIAIDIGTSKCRIAICKDEDIQIIEHESNQAIPSYVAYSKQDEWLVGKMAENYAACLQNVIYDIRWLLGKKKKKISKRSKKYFLKLSNKNKDGEAKFEFLVFGDSKDKPIGLKPVTASLALRTLLERIYTTAHQHINSPVPLAITIPMLSDENYRELTRNILQNDNHMIELVEEPIAVAAAYISRLELHPNSDVALVFCMGAGYLQVAAYFIKQQPIDWVIQKINGIKPIVRDDFAGNYFDQLIYDNMMGRLKAQNNNSLPNLSKWAQRRLKIECEKVKCTLSSAPSTRIDVDSLYRKGDEDCDLVNVIQKQEIEGYYNKEVDQIIKKVGKVYEKIKPKFILLAGGSTRIPLISEGLSGVFKDSTICNFLNVDEVAAIGAAAIASKAVTVANESIDYKQVIKIIQEQEKKEKEQPLAPEKASTQNANRMSAQGADGNAGARPDPTANENHVGNSQTPKIGGDNSFNNSHKILFYFYYRNNGEDEGRICLFNSSTCSVEEITKFDNYYAPAEVATTQNKIFGINSRNKSFEICDLNTRQISRGPDSPERRNFASVAYFKDKLYYLGGETDRVDVFVDGKWQTGPAFPLPVSDVQTITHDEVLYVIDGWGNRKIYRLSDDEREWIEIGEIPERRISFGVASLNGKIYITGGKSGDSVLKSYLCFDPSAPVGRRISRIADMNYERYNHSLIVANEKLYVIGGFLHGNVCNSIEEYDPQTNEWREVGKINIK